MWYGVRKVCKCEKLKAITVQDKRLKVRRKNDESVIVKDGV